ncbi:phospholipase C, partial [Actinomadura adrarensis]
MTQGLSRRRFLASGAGVAAGAAAFSVLPPSVHAALARPVKGGGLKAIKHVVFLMQENGWVAAKSSATMAYLDRQDMPLQYELADTFTICDAYHCSVPTSTSPNRNYFVSGYTGCEADGSRAVMNASYSDTHPGYTWPTYAELLERAGVSWKVYQEWDNFTDNNIEFFARFRAIAKKVIPAEYLSIESFYGAVRRADAVTRERLLSGLEEKVALLPADERKLYELALRRNEPGSLAANFRADIEAGKLPKVTYLVPSSVESEHPGDSSPIQSARIIYDVLDAIASNPEVWDSTALFITYDENDGLFDHVPPPRPPESVQDEHVGDLPLGLGNRV